MVELVVGVRRENVVVLVRDKDEDEERLSESL